MYKKLLALLLSGELINNASAGPPDYQRDYRQPRRVYGPDRRPSGQRTFHLEPGGAAVPEPTATSTPIEALNLKNALRKFRKLNH